MKSSSTLWPNGYITLTQEVLNAVQSCLADHQQVGWHVAALIGPWSRAPELLRSVLTGLDGLSIHADAVQRRLALGAALAQLLLSLHSLYLTATQLGAHLARQLSVPTPGVPPARLQATLNMVVDLLISACADSDADPGPGPDLGLGPAGTMAACGLSHGLQSVFPQAVGPSRIPSPPHASLRLACEVLHQALISSSFRAAAALDPGQPFEQVLVEATLAASPLHPENAHMLASLGTTSPMSPAHQPVPHSRWTDLPLVHPSSGTHPPDSSSELGKLAELRGAWACLQAVCSAFAVGVLPPRFAGRPAAAAAIARCSLVALTRASLSLDSTFLAAAQRLPPSDAAARLAAQMCHPWHAAAPALLRQFQAALVALQPAGCGEYVDANHQVGSHAAAGVTSVEGGAPAPVPTSATAVATGAAAWLRCDSLVFANDYAAYVVAAPPAWRQAAGGGVAGAVRRLLDERFAVTVGVLQACWQAAMAAAEEMQHAEAGGGGGQGSRSRDRQPQQQQKQQRTSVPLWATLLPTWLGPRSDQHEQRQQQQQQQAPTSGQQHAPLSLPLPAAHGTSTATNREEPPSRSHHLDSHPHASVTGWEAELQAQAVTRPATPPGEAWAAGALPVTGDGAAPPPKQAASVALAAGTAQPSAAAMHIERVNPPLTKPGQCTLHALAAEAEEAAPLDSLAVACLDTLSWLHFCRVDAPQLRLPALLHSWLDRVLASPPASAQLLRLLPRGTPAPSAPGSWAEGALLRQAPRDPVRASRLVFLLPLAAAAAPYVPLEASRDLLPNALSWVLAMLALAAEPPTASIAFAVTAAGTGPAPRPTLGPAAADSSAAAGRSTSISAVPGALSPAEFADADAASAAANAAAADAASLAAGAHAALHASFAALVAACSGAGLLGEVQAATTPYLSVALGPDPGAGPVPEGLARGIQALLQGLPSGCPEVLMIVEGIERASMSAAVVAAAAAAKMAEGFAPWRSVGDPWGQEGLEAQRHCRVGPGAGPGAGPSSGSCAADSARVADPVAAMDAMAVAWPLPPSTSGATIMAGQGRMAARPGSRGGERNQQGDSSIVSQPRPSHCDIPGGPALPMVPSAPSDLTSSGQGSGMSLGELDLATSAGDVTQPPPGGTTSPADVAHAWLRLLCEVVVSVDYLSLPAAVALLARALRRCPAALQPAALGFAYEYVLKCQDYVRKPHLVDWWYRDVVGALEGASA